MTGILAGLVFVGLFIAWAVVPNRIKKMHEAKNKREELG